MRLGQGSARHTPQEGDGLAPPTDPELLEEAVDVVLDRREANVKLERDGLVGSPKVDEVDDL